MRLVANWILRFGIIEFFSIIFASVNILAFLLYVADKRKSEKGGRRINKWALISFTLACGGVGAALGMCLAKDKAREKKFRLVAAIGLAIALIPLIHIAHSLTLDRAIRYVEIEYRSEDWPAGLDGYRIAFMTDMHTISDEEIGKVAAELNGRGLDLLLLGGDFSMEGGHYLGTVREIAQIGARDGIYGVEGNHDEYIRLFEAQERNGITPLDNGGKRIRDGFYLAGVRDLWNGALDVEAAVAGAGAGDFVLLVSHNPDVSMVQPMDGIDLILSGHTHGGQITFFGYPMFLLRGSITSYGTRFAHGFSRSADGVPVYTSSGVDSFYAVPRIFARPEVVIFTMRSERG